ncbi:MAG: hypothetical protein PHQ02_06710, partial [Candidatus Riflebacteria bacterium]|nr:hypothetical protein [Candidatus Riflebacteria bacterium]
MLRFTKNKRLLKVSISLCLGLVFSLANCSPARAVDGLFNGKFLTGENDDFVLWLQSYDQANSPYYNDLFFLNKAGNVGLGITNPSATLDIFGKAKITNNGIIYNQDSLRWLDMTGTLVDSLKVAKDIYSTAGVLKTAGTGNNYMLGKLGLGISSPAGRLHLEGGDLFLSNGNYYNSAGARYGGKISLFSSLKGRQVNNNPDFLEGLNNYNVYDNASSGTVSLSLVSDSTAPNSSGRVMRLSVSGTGAAPGRGGFYKATPLCSGTAVGHCLRQGNRHVVRIWAKIPADSSIQYASNSMGTGGSFQWISSRAGTGEWEEYIGQETMGAGASTTNFFYVADGAVPLTWDVASVEIIDIDSLADVDRAASLNVGYKNDIVLGDGNL